MSTCNRCGSEIVWVTTAKRGKHMPLDAEPNKDGTIVMRDGRAHVLSPDDADWARRSGEELWRPHFASCPARRRRRR